MYDSKRDKNRTLLSEKYLNMIRQYLSNKINDHKTQWIWKVYSGNKVIDYKNQSKWKIR